MVSSPNPPWSSDAGRPSSSKWSEATHQDRASMRPAAERIPRARNAAAYTDSATGLDSRGLTPHSVHQTAASSRPWRARAGRRSSGGLPYRWVLTKSRGTPVFSLWTTRSSTQPTAAVAGPPTRRAGSTERTARAAVSYRRR